MLIPFTFNTILYFIINAILIGIIIEGMPYYSDTVCKTIEFQSCYYFDHLHKTKKNPTYQYYLSCLSL